MPRSRRSSGTVARILGKPLYLGKIRRKVGGVWEVFDGAHEAIVDKDLWKRVNKSRASAPRRAGGRPLVKGVHLCTRGLPRCGQCGSAMIPVNRPRRDGQEAYLCIGHRDHGPDFCTQLSVRREMVDEPLLAELTSRYFDLDGARDRLRERQATEMALAALSEAELELQRCDARLAKITRGWQDEVISDAEFKKQRSALLSEREGAEAAVDQTRRKVQAIETMTATTDAEEALLSHLADLKRMAPAPWNVRRTLRLCGRRCACFSNASNCARSPPSASVRPAPRPTPRRASPWATVVCSYFPACVPRRSTSGTIRPASWSREKLTRPRSRRR